MTDIAPPKTTHVVYHIADLDGHMSGVIAYEALAEQGASTIMLHGHDYGFNHEELVAHFADGDDVYILDVSLPVDLMFKLTEREGDTVWIDHHASAIAEMEQLINDLKLKGVQEVGKAACVLAWEFFHPEEEIPMGIRLLGQYDIWQKKGEFRWDAEVMPFQYYWKYRDTNPADFELASPLYPLMRAGHDVITSMQVTGAELLDYQRRQCKIMAEAHAHEETIFFPNTDGQEYRAICINSNLRNSMALDAVFNVKTHAFMCVYAWTNGQWVLSFYHPDPPEGLNLGDLAKKGYGGGGHAGAAGCQLAELPWKL